MTKTWTLLAVVIALVIFAFGLIWVFSILESQEPAQFFPATINRDCAPWDGAAFTMSFRYDPSTTVTVSIWQSPNFGFPVTFSFPDETLRVGTAYSLREIDPLEELTGQVKFWRVEQGIPVEGEFDFITRSGKQFKGKFKAEWGDLVAYCG